MTYIGVLDEPPNGFRRMKCLTNDRRDCTVWARGSLFSPDFAWCHVRREPPRPRQSHAKTEND